jgi:hypothetical protein
MSDDARDAGRQVGWSRRRFVGLGGAVLGASLAPRAGPAVPPASAGEGPSGGGLMVAPPLEVVRIGLVGVGGQGMVHVENLLAVPGARITAVCDVIEERVQMARRRVVEAGQPEPAAYSRGPRDFERLCETEELDLVLTATPWEWHVPVCLAAMKSGKHAATEVPAACTLEDCWALVEHAAKHARHCVMLENCNYGRMELLVLNLVRRGLLGEVLHGEGGYLHDLREVKFASTGEGLWRRAHAWRRNGNLYPTHGLGPLAQCMDINRGDRFDYLVSMSGPSRGLPLYARENFPPGSPQREERFALGDVNLCLIKTVQGRTIYLSHDTNLPRPYSRIHLVQGTRGIFQGYPDRVYLEGRSPRHRWEPAEGYLAEYGHPLWRNSHAQATQVGHGGMDYLEVHRLVQCLREGLPTDMNVYDAAALSAVTPLSEASVATRGRPVDFPDFTRGRFARLPPLPIAGD